MCLDLLVKHAAVVLANHVVAELKQKSHGKKYMHLQENIYYNLLINIRVVNKRTNLGNMYFENTYIIITSKIKANVT